MAPPSKDDVKALTDLIASTLALLKQFSSSLTSQAKTADSSTSPIATPPNPLQVLHDSATLLKAHTTKLSLLAINKPFTPSAITKVLSELSGTCLPAMMSATQICSQEKSTWGAIMSREVEVRISRVFREMENLLSELQSITDGTSSSARRDSLSSTGIVWESCDALIDLNKMGIAGLAVRKAEQYRDSIKDALEELQEWREGGDEEHEGLGDDELLDSDDEVVDGDKDSVEDLFNAANSMPTDRPGLKELVESTEAKGKKVVLLFTALVKRRLKPFKPDTGKDGNVERLDSVMASLKAVQEDLDEVISNFYDLDEQGAKSQLEKCLSEAKKAVDAAKLDWTGKEDEFTAWSVKWVEAVR